MQRISAPAIHKGSLIGIAAPATCIEKNLLEKGAQKLAAWGYAVQKDERILARYRSFAGSDEMRADVLENLIKNPSIRSIWCARGGYGVTRILPLLDTKKIPTAMARNPKLIIGYSDITALQLYFWEKIKLKSLHGPLVATPKWLKLAPAQAHLLQKILAGKMPLGAKSHSVSWPTKWLDSSPKKSVEGILLGGNLTLLANLAGTPWQPNLKGCILFLEDCAEPPYRIDRMLTQMRNAGMLEGVRAVVAGDFMADVVLKPGEKKNAWQDSLRDCLCDWGIPVLVGAKFGHGKFNEPMPQGILARITRSGALEFWEQVVGK